MTYLKKSISALLFVTAFTATQTVVNTVLINRLTTTVEAFEPVVIEQVVEVVPQQEVTTEPVIEEPSVVESEPSVYETESISAPFPFIINCPLDDETQEMIFEKSAEYNIEFAFVMGVIYAESRFQANADSGSSVGLMQINRINHEWLSETLGITDFWDPEQNVSAGLYMLRMLFERYQDPAMVLMAYNHGETGAKRLWDKGIYSTDYAEIVLQQADIYNQEIQERMGEE